MIFFECNFFTFFAQEQPPSQTRFKGKFKNKEVKKFKKTNVSLAKKNKQSVPTSEKQKAIKIHFLQKKETQMGFKLDPNKPDTWMVWYSKRHPVTRKPVQLRQSGLKSKAEAKKAEAQLIIAVEDKLRRKVLPSWFQLVHNYREHMVEQEYAVKTADNYFLCLRAHTFEGWSDRLVDNITSQEIRELIKNRAGHRSPSHQKHILKFIRGAFKYALEMGHIKHNPTPDMKFRIGYKIKKVLTEEQATVFLNRAKEYDMEWYPHWCLALYTGMRNGELYALTWDKVSFEERQILVDKAWNTRDGFKDTKSGDDRMIQIAPSLMEILRELKLKNPESNPFVLPRISKWNKGEQARELRMFLAGLGLTSIRFHDLRATWATLLLSKGVTPIKVMIMGGWKDLKTMQIYVRKAGVDVKGAADCLEFHSVSSKQDAQVLEL